MTDDHELVGLDPFNILDQEAGRLDAFFSTRSGEEWLRPTRCDEWTVADVLRHLAATEVYHQACLDGTVAALVTQVGERGATDLDSANALGVADSRTGPPANCFCSGAARTPSRAGGSESGATGPSTPPSASTRVAGRPSTWRPNSPRTPMTLACRLRSTRSPTEERGGHDSPGLPWARPSPTSQSEPSTR